jgi:serine/threonine-protein kinase
MTERFGIDFAGKTLAGRYDVLELLGAGGMGAVYSAHDRELDEVVALKVIHTDLADRPEIVERFRREVKLARRVTHANIARTFELGSADGVMFCTMELVDGESLRERLVRERKLGVAEAIAIAIAVCEGLAAAHAAGIVHRDIKPDNVLLRTDGRIVLADFGIAALTTGDGDLSGTPAYMAPEQARGEPATPATDVYAVGVVLYEMVTGTRAFRGDLDSILEAKETVEHLVPQDAPPELARVIAHATEREAARRIASAAELARVLAAWARPSQVNTVVSRAAPESRELHTVVVVAPRADGVGERLYVAAGVHEELLRRLTHRPRLRVLPRVEAGERDAATTVVELVAGRELAVSIRGPGRDVTMRLPLEVGELASAADSIAVAVGAGLEREESSDASRQALELLLRARQLGQLSIANYPKAFELLERASQLAPDDPRIIAMLALACVRVGTFRLDDQTSSLMRARQLVDAALRAAPGLAESHVAAAHLELHTGEAPVAAIHFRRAIACSRYIAEGHEGLGRLLLEAGFLDVALPRLEDALAIAPNLSVVRWDIVRAWALEGRWDIADAMLAELIQTVDRIVARVRFACWRGDRDTIDKLCRRFRGQPSARLDPFYLESMYGVVLDNDWPVRRDELVARARDSKITSRRGLALVAQLVAEVAGWAGDGPTSLAITRLAVDRGLYDLHWLDRCPVLAATRAEPGFLAVRAVVAQRADKILDALYGDHDLAALSDTVAV